MKKYTTCFACMETADQVIKFFTPLPFWLLVASFFLAIYVGFTATEEYWVAVVVFGAIAIAGILNMKKVGPQHGIVFTILQCIAIYCSVIVLILYAIFKNAKELGPKID